MCIVQVLNLTAKGWEEASRHALRAVTTDNRMRMWLADDAASTGLLFRCARGRIALDTPVGVPPATHPAGAWVHLLPAYAPSCWRRVGLAHT